MRGLACALLIVLLGAGVRPAAAGAFDCSITAVSPVSVTYDPLSGTPASGSGTLTLSCTKTGSNTDTRYVEIGAGTGLQPSGAQARAANGASLLSYTLTRDSALSAPWQNSAGTRIAPTAITGTDTITVTQTLNWWIVFPASQPAAAGTYTDTVTLTLYQDSVPNPALTDKTPRTTTLSVSASVVNNCRISSAPGAVAFTYTSFQTTPATASSSFAVTCTNGTPYTATLDATTGTLLGLNYTLAVSPSGTRTGNGAAQAMSITGTMAAGQSGTCATASCSASQVRTLTITY